MEKKIYLFCILYCLSNVSQEISAQPNTMCSNHIKHYWNLNENQGSDLIDVIGNNNASEHINTIPSAGIIDGSRFFNGSSEVNIPNHEAFNWNANSSFSIEFWMKKTSVCTSNSSSGNNVIIGRDDPSTNLHWWVGVSCQFGGKISFNLFDISGNGIELVGTNNVTDGVWHHVVVTRNAMSNTTAIYVDGTLNNSVVNTYTSGFQSVKNVNLGWLNLSGGYHFNGYLDELAIYDTVIPQSSIVDHYNSGNGNEYCENSPTNRIKIMPIGTSMTEGWTDGSLANEQMRSYRYDLKNMLEGNGIPVDFVGSQLTGSAFFSDCQNAGISGTRDQFVARLLTDGYDERWGVQILNPPRYYLDEYSPDIILLDVGTNDVTHETTPWASGTEKFTNILNLIDSYEQRANKEVTVFLALIINRKFGIPLRDKTSEFNNNIRALAEARIAAGDQIVIVDLEHDAGFEYTDADITSTDPQGLHPNSVGYTKMALAWFNKLSEFLDPANFKPQVILSAVDTGRVNNAYSSKVFAISKPAPVFSFISAPAGMTINSQTGSISWTPAIAGDYTISVLVSNSMGSDTCSWLLHIAGSIFMCTNGTFTDQTGTITDNSGAGNYFNGMDCMKLIQTTNAASITLSFTQFNTEAGYDFVRIYNGSTTSAPLLGQYSGTNLPPTLTSTSGSMLIRFTTDNGVVAPGWSANYTASTGNPCVNETYASQTGTITDNSGSANYLDNMDCQKLIQPANATSITVNFTQFSTEAGYDFVRVYNGSNTSAPLLGQFSGTNIPASVTSTGGSMLIRFTSDNGVVAQGWSANYISNSGSPCTNETFTAQTGTITDNSGTGNYFNGMDCQKLIQPTNAASITLNFSQFNTEAGYDFVRVYNGATTSAPLLGQFSGTTLPNSVTSTGGSMLIRFTTDNGVVAPGWSANYTVNTGSPCTNETFITQTGTITDNSGTGNYFNGMDCQKLIQPANAASITLTFSQFNTEAGYDFVRVYNGATTSSPLLGQFSGTALPKSVTSTGGSMLVRFTSDNGVVASGWTANYSVNAGTPCTNEILTAQSGTITDNSGTGNYFNGMDCQKLIQPANAASITLSFTQFNTEAGYDFVYVYNGSTTSSPLLGQYSGTSIPSSLTSTGGSMLIRFTSDNGVVAPGWSANFTSNPGSPCINETFTAQTGTITDNSSTGNYFDRMDCQKLIQPANATSITLNFSQFNTEAGYDFVRVYNGSTTSAPLLGQYSGTSLPPSLTSTGGSMLIRFTTDNGVVAAGWSAQYSTSSNAPLLKRTQELASNNSEGMRLVVYPNPVEETLTIELNSTENQIFKFELVNTSGQVNISRNTHIINGKYELDVSTILPGLYILKVTSDKESDLIRIIKL